MKNQKLNKAFALLVAAGALAMTGCDSGKSSVNEATMGTAVNQYLAEGKGDLCLMLPKWPVEVGEHDISLERKMPAGVANQMSVLASLGLVTEADGETDQMVGAQATGRKFRIRTYTLTDEGKKYYQGEAVPFAATAGAKPKVKGDLCYGKKAVAKVVKWDALPESGADKEFNVRYLYKVEGLAEWAKRPEFRSAFPGAARIIDGAEKEQQTHGVKVTAMGIVPRGLKVI